MQTKFLEMLYYAPELLRVPMAIPTKEADIYAFAVICSEIVTKKSVYDLENRSEKVEGKRRKTLEGNSILI